MNVGKFVMAVAVCLVLTGCRTDPNIVLLERDLRLQEKEIDRLKWSLEDCDAEVRTLQRENEGLRQGSISTQTPYPSSSPGISPKSNGRTHAKVDPDIPPGAIMVPPDVEVPKTFLPEGELPEIFKKRGQGASSGDRSTEPSSELPPLESGRRGAPGDGPALGSRPKTAARRLPVVKGDSRQVAKISLNPQMTGGYRSDGQKTDDGLALVIEPRDSQGRLVDAAGDIRVAVVDPSIPGAAGRIGRWDFSAKEAAQLFRNDGVQGIQLDVPWPDAPPKTDNLHLYVRYKTADGRALQIDRPIQVDLAGRAPRRLPVGDIPTAEGPSLLATRKGENWKTAAAPADPMPADIAPLEGEPSPRSLAERNAAPRNDEREPLVASRPSSPPSDAPRPAPKAPSLQRPVWSPDRP